MEKLLKPQRLDLDPNSPAAAKNWKHWLRILNNFFDECGNDAPDKLKTLISFVSSDVYDYIEECTTYDSAIDVLSKLFVKTPNVIFSRHLLATRKQKPGESLDEFLQELQRLSKDCAFKAVTADQYRQEVIRESFINGLVL